MSHAAPNIAIIMKRPMIFPLYKAHRIGFIKNPHPAGMGF